MNDQDARIDQVITTNNSSKRKDHGKPEQVHVKRSKLLEDGEEDFCIQQPLPQIMRLLFWNCRGLGNPRSVRELHLLKENFPSLVFLSETKPVF